MCACVRVCVGGCVDVRSKDECGFADSLWRDWRTGHTTAGLISNAAVYRAQYRSCACMCASQVWECGRRLCIVDHIRGDQSRGFTAATAQRQQQQREQRQQRQQRQRIRAATAATHEHRPPQPPSAHTRRRTLRLRGLRAADGRQRTDAFGQRNTGKRTAMQTYTQDR